MIHNETTTTETNYIIDGVTYTVTALSAQGATETLHRKIEKLLIRDLSHSPKDTADDMKQI
jgi:hypothetical protein